MNNYAVIVGHGRSGTNWLHKLFDLSEETYCRNEPHELSDSPISRFNYQRVIVRNDQEILINDWDNTIKEVGCNMSYFDAWIKDKKNYFNSSKFIYICLRSNKIRNLLSFFSRELKKNEWALPIQAVKTIEWEKARRIYKFVMSPGWSVFLLKNRKNVPVFHIVRHPGGFLNSWKNRYLLSKEKEDVYACNLKRLEDIAHESDYWRNKFGDINQLDLNESELWYWYYANETIFQAGKGKSQYTLLSFEDLTKQPVKILNVLYQKTGLAVDDRIMKKVVMSSKNSRNIAGAWRESLAEKEINQCEKFVQMARNSFGTDLDN